MSIYAIVSIDSSLQYFPQNKAYHFKCHLNTSLNLEGLWKGALLETNISTSKSLKIFKPLYVYFNICGESMVDGDKRPILRKLPGDSHGTWDDTVFEMGHYMPVKINNIDNIDIYIMTTEGVLASFLDQPTIMTLHYKAFPFL